ncbi:uncharacterized protein LOC135221944 isoform X2 [Macrobrachium nipponense]|uniref:uncharacterized protein LOC135221944 isoform X2 n=1 Tax=Macrobrachium nipponense TaxID=159736 RepID=UPI0030C88B6A
MGRWAGRGFQTEVCPSVETVCIILLLMTVSSTTLGEDLGDSSRGSEYQHEEMVSSLVHKLCPRGCGDPEFEAVNNTSLSFSALCHLVCFTLVETSGGASRNTLGKQYDNRRQGIFSRSVYNSDFPSAFKSGTGPPKDGKQVAKTQSGSKFYFDKYSREKIRGPAQGDLGNSGNGTNDLESSLKERFFRDLAAPLTSAGPSNISKIKQVLCCGFHINPSEHLQGAPDGDVLRNSHGESIQLVKNSGINLIKVDNYSSENISTSTYRLHARTDVLPLPSRALATNSSTGFKITAQGFNSHRFLHNIINIKNVSHFRFPNHPKKNDLSIQRNAAKFRWDPFHISSTMSNNTVNTVGSPYPLENYPTYYSVQVLPMQNTNADVLREKVTFPSKSERREFQNPEKNTQDGTEKKQHSSVIVSFDKKHGYVNPLCPEFVDYSPNDPCEMAISRTRLPHVSITLPPNNSEFHGPSESLYGRVSPLSLLHSSLLPSKSSPSLFSSMSSSLSQVSSRASATRPLGLQELPHTGEFLNRKPFSEKILLRSRRTVISSDTSFQPGTTKVRKTLQRSSMALKSTSILSNAIKPTRQQNIILVQTQNTAVLNFLSGLGPLKLESESIGRKNPVDQLPNCRPVSKCTRKYGDHPLDFCIYGFLPSCQEGYVRCLDNYFGPFNELCLNELSSLKDGSSSQTKVLLS